LLRQDSYRHRDQEGSKYFQLKTNPVSEMLRFVRSATRTRLEIQPKQLTICRNRCNSRLQCRYSQATILILETEETGVHSPTSVLIISIVKPTRCTNVSNLFYFEMTLYMFRTVSTSIIRSTKLYILQQALVKQILLSV